MVNLLFKFGHLVEIRDVIREGLRKIRLDNWLLVIQQLLARLDTPREQISSIIIDLLISVGQHYPQSMVYPLVLAFKSGGSDVRRYNANRILYSMEKHSSRLVSEAFLVSGDETDGCYLWLLHVLRFSHFIYLKSAKVVVSIAPG